MLYPYWHSCRSFVKSLCKSPMFYLTSCIGREPRQGHGGDVHGPGFHATAAGLGRKEHRARLQDVQTRRSTAPPAQPHLFQGATLRTTRLW